MNSPLDQTALTTVCRACVLFISFSATHARQTDRSIIITIYLVIVPGFRYIIDETMGFLMEPNDYVNRLRHAVEISETPRFSPEYIAQCCTYAENLRLPQVHHSQTQWEPDHHGSQPQTEAPSAVDLSEYLDPKRSFPVYHGFVPERSIVTNAILHIGYAYTYCVDITDFFPSITKKQVLPIFRNMGYSGSAANTLCDLCC